MQRTFRKTWFVVFSKEISVGQVASATWLSAKIVPDYLGISNPSVAGKIQTDTKEKIWIRWIILKAKKQKKKKNEGSELQWWSCAKRLSRSLLPWSCPRRAVIQNKTFTLWCQTMVVECRAVLLHTVPSGKWLDTAGCLCFVIAQEFRFIARDATGDFLRSVYGFRSSLWYYPKQMLVIRARRIMHDLSLPQRFKSVDPVRV